MVSLEFNPINFPVGTRFTYKNFYDELLYGEIYEWSPSGDHVNVSGQWHWINCSLKPFIVVEVLNKEPIMSLDYQTASMECARYIFDSDAEQISYQEFIQDGNDPRDHILYHAAVVLGEEQEFEIDINEYEKAVNNG